MVNREVPGIKQWDISPVNCWDMKEFAMKYKEPMTRS
jgi:hypothetical protein